jgi:hypothetical protein
VLPTGKTIRGDFEVAGAGTGAGTQAAGSISFGFTFSATPTVIIVPPSTIGTSNCAAGTEQYPNAAPGYLCVYEEAVTDSGNVVADLSNPYGATLDATSTGAGEFSVEGTWAATSP